MRGEEGESFCFCFVFSVVCKKHHQMTNGGNPGALPRPAARGDHKPSFPVLAASRFGKMVFFLEKGGFLLLPFLLGL